MRATIAPQLSQVPGQTQDWTIKGPVFHNRNGRLFKARHPGAPYSLAIKVHHQESLPPEALARHYAALETYFHAMPADQSLTVPEPVLLDVAHSTMVMHWVAAPLMSKTLLAAGMNAKARRRQFTKAGRWLSAFHAHACGVAKPFDGTRHIAAANRIAGEIPGPASNGSARRNLSLCLEALDRFRPEFEGTELIFGRRHGDFTPTNIFADDRCTTGIDFLPAMQGPLVTDICRFMAYADVYKYGLTLPWQMDHLAGSAGDLAAFMAGYGGNSIVPSERMMSYLQLAEITRRIAARTKAVALNGRTAWRMIELHRLIRRSRYLIKKLSG